MFIFKIEVQFLKRYFMHLATLYEKGVEERKQQQKV